ncbi:helix-turn-helix domain-containing protein [Nakamurella sp. PAMC28650]|uniref:helix-turn-helix domain-containing protein n=1 Tax=Nakamurella sp. PAMC28650 TaxID=2762325 RepID=UPI00164E8464|nr:helix-turn-helix transcriptional regulator [Nakamurella sp. PAMC28650]QNK82848.1 helix-turn-helix transcriptional regulator [Nakamurella sp. PAMC28650]
MARSFDAYADQLAGNWNPATRAVADQAAAFFAAQVTAQLDLGAQIAQARIGSHLSQTDLGVRSGVPQPEISRIERGAGNPTRETLNKLATALNARFVLVPLAAVDVAQH